MSDASITSLQVVVKSDGIDQAAASLKVLVAAAAEAGVKVSDFVTKLKPLPKVQEDATDKAEKLIAAFKQQVALLGANQAAVNSYKTTMKGGTSAQVEMASSLGSEVDAYRAKVAAQKISTAETLKNEKATLAATEATRLFNAAVADNRVGPTRQTFKDSLQEEAEETRKLSEAKAKLAKETRALEAEEAKFEKNLRRAFIEDQARSYKLLALSQADAAKSGKDLNNSSSELAAMHDRNTSKLLAERKAVSDSKLAGDQYLASLKNQSDVLGLVGQKLRDYTAEQQRAKAATLGVSAEAEPMIKKLQETGKAAGNAHTGVAGITREFIVLGHEMSQGQFTRLGGSAMVMAEKFDVAKYAMKAWTAATVATGLATLPLALGIGAIAAAVALLAAGVVTYYHSAAALHEFRNEVILTGGSAGATGDQLYTMATKIGLASGELNNARKAAIELTASGKFTAAQIGQIAESAVNLQRYGGVAIETTIKQFEKLAKEPLGNTEKSFHSVSKAAMELDEKLHFLEPSILAQALAYENMGKTAEASKLIIDNFYSVMNGRIEDTKKNMSSLSQWWDKTIKDMANGWNSMFAKEDDEAVLAKAKSRLASLAKNDPNFGQTKTGQLMATEIAEKQIALDNKVTKAKKDASDSEIRRNAVTATMSLNSLDERTKGEMKYAEKVKKLNAEEADQLKAGIVTSKALHDQRMAQLLKEDTVKAKKAPSTEGSGYALAIEDVKGPADARKKIYEDAIKLIDAEVKYKVKSTEEGAKETEAILKAEHESAMALFKDEIDITAKFRRGELNQLNEMDKNKKKYESDRAAENAANLLRLKTNLLAEEYAAGEGERYAEKAFNTSQKNLTKENDLLRDKFAAYKALPEAMRKAGVTEKQMADLATQNHIDRLQAQVGVGPRSNEENDRLMSQIAELKVQKKLLEESEGNDATNKLALQSSAEMKSNSKKIGDDLANAILEGGTQGYSKLIKNMTMDFARMVLRPILQPAADSIAKMLGGGGSAAASGLGGGLGGLAADAASWFGAAPAVGSMGGGGMGALLSSMNMADGGDVSAGNTHIVGERGAELFVPKSAGTIVPTGQFNNDKGTTIHYSPNISIDSRSDQAQIHAMVSGAVRQGQADLVERLSRAGRI